MKIILLIGRIACGKSTYARAQKGTVLLSCDQLMQTLFPGGCGEHHDVIALRAHQYLFHLAKQCADGGATPLLDFGFWTKASRQAAVEALAGYELDWRYLSIPEDEWKRRIAKRNAAIESGQGDPTDYYVDKGLLEKAERLFEEPQEGELEGMTVICT